MAERPNEIIVSGWSVSPPWPALWPAQRDIEARHEESGACWLLDGEEFTAEVTEGEKGGDWQGDVAYPRSIPVEVIKAMIQMHESGKEAE